MNSIKKRIAHLIYSPALGGSEMFAAEICAHLDRSLFEPMVLFNYPFKGPMPEILDTYNVKHFNLNRNRVSQFYDFFFVAFKLRRLNIDILHVHHIPLLSSILFAARMAGIKKIVFTEHAKHSISRSPKLQNACRKAARQVDRFTVVSENLKCYFTHDLGIAQDLISVVYNGVDTEKFKPQNKTGQLRRLTPNCAYGFVMISVGRLTEAKDYANLFRALKALSHEMKPPTVVIIGDGELMPVLAKEVMDLGLGDYVVLAGRHLNISELLADADAFIMSSKREGLPTALLEAMSCGLPIIATEVGGIPEAVKNEYNGILVQPENPSALANAIKKICLHTSLREQLGENARKTIQNKFSFEYVANRFSEMYTELGAMGSA